MHGQKDIKISESSSHCVAWNVSGSHSFEIKYETRYTPPKSSGLKTLFLTTAVHTVNSVSLWTLRFISLWSSLFMKHHMLYNKIVYCYDVTIYFPARIHRTYFCAMLSVHYLSSCARSPLSWQILIIPKATKKSIYSTFLPGTAPLLCDICYYSE